MDNISSQDFLQAYSMDNISSQAFLQAYSMDNISSQAFLQAYNMDNTSSQAFLQKVNKTKIHLNIIRMWVVLENANFNQLWRDHEQSSEGTSHCIPVLVRRAECQFLLPTQHHINFNKAQIPHTLIITGWVTSEDVRSGEERETLFPTQSCSLLLNTVAL